MHEIRFIGSRAVAVLVLAAAVAAWQYTTARATLGSDGAAVVKRALVAEYRRYHLARAGLDDAERARIALSLESLTLSEITARGRPRDTVVRVVIAPHPAMPPGAAVVRYFRMRHTALAGWLPPGPARATQYHLTWY